MLPRIIDGWRVARRHRAVFLERGLECSQHFRGRVAAHRFVLVENDRVALLLGDCDGQDLGGELSRHLSRCRLLVAVRGVLILLIARHLVEVRHRLAGVAHVPVFERAPQAVVNHQVDDRSISHAESFAHFRDDVGTVAHRLMPPATAMSMSPVWMPCCASITAFRPDPHTLLMVSAPT